MRKVFLCFCLMVLSVSVFAAADTYTFPQQIVCKAQAGCKFPSGWSIGVATPIAGTYVYQQSLGITIIPGLSAYASAMYRTQDSAAHHTLALTGPSNVSVKNTMKVLNNQFEWTGDKSFLTCKAAVSQCVIATN